jgi:hypothetical protein
MMDSMGVKSVEISTKGFTECKNYHSIAARAKVESTRVVPLQKPVYTRKLTHKYQRTQTAKDYQDESISIAFEEVDKDATKLLTPYA